MNNPQTPPAAPQATSPPPVQHPGQQGQDHQGQAIPFHLYGLNTNAMRKPQGTPPSAKRSLFK